MATKSFTESNCETALALGGYGPHVLASERGLIPNSDFAFRGLSETRRPGGRWYPNYQVRNVNGGHYGIPWTPTCSQDQCYLPSVNAFLQNQLMYENSFTRDKATDLNNQRSYELLMNRYPTAIRTRADMADLLEQDVKEKNLCARNPEVYLDKNMPLFLHDPVNTQQMFNPPDNGYQFEKGSTKEFITGLAHTLSQGQSVQPVSIPYDIGQSSRITSPTKRFCRSDFTPDLPPL